MHDVHENIPRQTVLLCCGEAKFEVKSEKVFFKKIPGSELHQAVDRTPYRHRDERFVKEYLAETEADRLIDLTSVKMH